MPQPFPRAGLLDFFPKTRDSKSASGSEAGLLVAPGIPPNARNSPGGFKAAFVPSSCSLRVCSCSIFRESDLMVAMNAWNWGLVSTRYL